MKHLKSFCSLLSEINTSQFSKKNSERINFDFNLSLYENIDKFIQKYKKDNMFFVTFRDYSADAHDDYNKGRPFASAVPSKAFYTTNPSGLYFYPLEKAYKLYEDSINKNDAIKENYKVNHSIMSNMHTYNSNKIRKGANIFRRILMEDEKGILNSLIYLKLKNERNPSLDTSLSKVFVFYLGYGGISVKKKNNEIKFLLKNFSQSLSDKYKEELQHLLDANTPIQVDELYKEQLMKSVHSIKKRYEVQDVFKVPFAEERRHMMLFTIPKGASRNDRFYSLYEGNNYETSSLSELKKDYEYILEYTLENIMPHYIKMAQLSRKRQRSRYRVGEAYIKNEYGINTPEKMEEFLAKLASNHIRYDMLYNICAEKTNNEYKELVFKLYYHSMAVFHIVEAIENKKPIEKAKREISRSMFLKFRRFLEEGFPKGFVTSDECPFIHEQEPVQGVLFDMSLINSFMFLDKAHMIKSNEKIDLTNKDIRDGIKAFIRTIKINSLGDEDIIEDKKISKLTYEIMRDKNFHPEVPIEKLNFKYSEEITLPTEITNIRKFVVPKNITELPNYVRYDGKMILENPNINISPNIRGDIRSLVVDKDFLLEIPKDLHIYKMYLKFEYDKDLLDNMILMKDSPNIKQFLIDFSEASPSDISKALEDEIVTPLDYLISKNYPIIKDIKLRQVINKKMQIYLRHKIEKNQKYINDYINIKIQHKPSIIEIIRYSKSHLDLDLDYMKMLISDFLNNPMRFIDNHIYGKYRWKGIKKDYGISKKDFYYKLKEFLKVNKNRDKVKRNIRHIEFLDFRKSNSSSIIDKIRQDVYFMKTAFLILKVMKKEGVEYRESLEKIKSAVNMAKSK